MDVYFCTDFKGHYPVGTSAVVVAMNALHARDLLIDELNKIGLPQTDRLTIEPLTTNRSHVIILQDGNY